MKYLHLLSNRSRKIFFLVLSFLLLPKVTFGAGGTDINVSIENPLKAQSFEDLIGDMMNVVIQLGIPIIAILIMFSGFKFIEAQGKPTKLEEAKKSLWYVLIGTAVVLGAGTILTIIRSTVDVL
jgi:hypothetical protein